MKSDNKIICKCYGREQEFNSSKEAVAFFLDCMRMSEGCERERYTNVYLDLLDGKKYCTDEEKI